jgi:ParB-like chromosome segregation protein Spo0J
MQSSSYRASCEVQSVAIDVLLTGISPRLSGEDEEHVQRLAETDAALLPPILVHRATMQVIDGMHRLRAAALRGQHEIAVSFFEGSEEAAFLHAVRENVQHGLPLSTADRKSAAIRIIVTHPALSDRAIASFTGLSAKTVGTLRRRSTAGLPHLNMRLGADGRSRPLNAATGRRRAAQLVVSRPDMPVREIAKVAGVSVGTAHDVRRRINQGEDPVPSGGRRVATNGDGVFGHAVPAIRPAAKPDVHPGQQYTFVLLQRLTNDPAMRHTDLGRRLIRLLSAHVAALELPGMVEAIPPHCLTTVAELARQCADGWNRLAAELERRKIFHRVSS